MNFKAALLALIAATSATAGTASPSASCAGFDRPTSRLSDGKNFAVSSSKEASAKSLDELTCGADRGDPSAQLALGVR